MVKNKQCLCCSTNYSYCPNCSRADKLAPTWKAQFCDENCMTLWMTLTRYNMGNHSKSEAKEIISSLDLKPIDNYVACVQRDYAKVMAEDKKPRKIKKQEPVIETEILVEQPIAEIEQVVEIIEPIVAIVEESTVHEVVKEENE